MMILYYYYYYFSTNAAFCLLNFAIFSLLNLSDVARTRGQTLGLVNVVAHAQSM
jgi:hypothetical protein